ncbi:protein of unknown function DUF4520 [Trypanosoma melophagium]|nr:protein of unknown function DUF4520 [Trypanosoma melophagium]
MRILSNDPALSAAAAEGNVVYLTSFIDGIGNFAALTNGTIRCHFDDRTILFLVPGADDSEENIIATCLFRDATQCSMRIVKCLPHHPMFRYITHALQFRRFARLSPESRNQVVEENDATMKLMLISPEETRWRRENEVEHKVQELVTRTQEVLLGSEELGRANRSLLHDEYGDVGGSSSAYFS